MRQYLATQINEFNKCEIGTKICLVGSWLTAGGVALLVGASAVTVAAWGQGKEPNNLTKQALFLGLGTFTGASLFTVGVALEDERQAEEIAQDFYKRIAEKRAQKEASPCPNCKFFSGDCDLYCAVNPVIACTKESENCFDFEPKEIVSHGS